MNNKYILKMLEDGKIEELKKTVQDEIYQKELNNIPGAKQRYAAMKRYFKFANDKNVFTCKPKQIEGLSCFVDGLTAVRTKESLNDIPQYDDSDIPYIDLNGIMNLESVSDYTEEINFNEVLAEAKAGGYKFKKNEIIQGDGFTTVFFYNGAYFKVGLLDQAFSIINDGEKATVYSTGRAISPIKIVTSIGECVLMPVKPKDTDKSFASKTVIKVVSKHFKEVV